MLLELGRRIPTQANKEIIKGRKNNLALSYLMQIREPQDSLRKPSLPHHPSHIPAQTQSSNNQTNKQPPPQQGGRLLTSEPPKAWDLTCGLHSPYLDRLRVLWDLFTKSAPWTGTPWGDANNTLNISYLHVLSRGRMIQSSLIQEQETKLYDTGTGNKAVHVMCALKEYPACVCVCVWHDTEQSGPPLAPGCSLQYVTCPRGCHPQRPKDT